MEDFGICILWPFGIFYGHLVYFMPIWNILCSFSIFYAHLVYFMPIWNILCPFDIFCCTLVYLMVIWYIFFQFWHAKKIWQPCPLTLLLN
jgi:hypothetical protein